MSCTKLGKNVIAAHATAISASIKALNLRDELLYEQARPRRISAPKPELLTLKRKIKDAETTAGVLDARYERLMQAYRRRCSPKSWSR
jgi:hypothetical protein